MENFISSKTIVWILCKTFYLNTFIYNMDFYLSWSYIKNSYKYNKVLLLYYIIIFLNTRNKLVLV